MDVRLMIADYEHEIRTKVISEFAERVTEEVARRDTTDGTVKVFSGREVVEIVRGVVRYDQYK